MWLDMAIVVFLMGLAIGLILLEIFLLPGITLAGIGGFLFAVGGIAYAYHLGAWTGNVTLIGSVLVFAGIFVWMLRARSFNRVALKTDVDSRLTSCREQGIRPGDEGITLSRLAPIGKARINGVTVEAKSQEELIDEKTPVVVLRVDGYNVVVKKKL